VTLGGPKRLSDLFGYYLAGRFAFRCSAAALAAFLVLAKRSSGVMFFAAVRFRT
jgi:hypothetical protein